MLDESAMNEFLDSGAVADERLKAMISARSLFPVFFGSALAMEGIDGFLAGFERYTKEIEPGARFGARVYKVSHDEHGNRLTWLRVTGGEIKAKMVLDGDEKADQVRLYSGAKFTTVDALPPARSAPSPA